MGMKTEYDRHITRCPICGEWTWRGICYVHSLTRAKEKEAA